MGLRKYIDKYTEALGTQINDAIFRANTISEQHKKTFSKYKNIHRDDIVVIVASGQTLKYYESIPNAIHIGVNRTIESDIPLNYIFLQDISGANEYIEKVVNSSSECKVFLGRLLSNNLPQTTIPEYIIEKSSAERYYTTYPYHYFSYDLLTNGLPDCRSVVFSAFSFALWTHPREIYIVGCDCSSKYFDGHNGHSFSYLIKFWSDAANFASAYYPDIKIKLVNPLGLKNLFPSVYTKSYLESFNYRNFISVFFAVDDEYSPYLCTAIYSMLENTNSFVSIKVIDCGISKENIKLVKDSITKFSNYDITFIKVSLEEHFPNFKGCRYLSTAMYARILVPYLFNNSDKAIYSDVDVIFQGDISKLWEINLDGKAIGACYEYFQEDNNVNRERLARLNINSDHRYFSSGLLLMDIEQCLQMRLKERVVETWGLLQDKLDCPDQDILNYIFRSNYKLLSSSFCVVNQIASSYKDDVVIRHFNGPKKPWLFLPLKRYERTLPGVLSFWDVAKKTRFYKTLIMSIIKNKINRARCKILRLF